MAITNKEVLKSYFERGDKPTASEFGELIDSFPQRSTIRQLTENTELLQRDDGKVFYNTNGWSVTLPANPEDGTTYTFIEDDGSTFLVDGNGRNIFQVGVGAQPTITLLSTSQIGDQTSSSLVTVTYSSNMDYWFVTHDNNINRMNTLLDWSRVDKTGLGSWINNLTASTATNPNYVDFLVYDDDMDIDGHRLRGTDLKTLIGVPSFMKTKIIPQDSDYVFNAADINTIFITDGGSIVIDAGLITTDCKIEFMSDSTWVYCNEDIFASEVVNGANVMAPYCPEVTVTLGTVAELMATPLDPNVHLAFLVTETGTVWKDNGTTYVNTNRPLETYNSPTYQRGYYYKKAGLTNLYGWNLLDGGHISTRRSSDDWYSGATNKLDWMAGELRWNQLNKTGSSINDLADVDTEPSVNDILYWDGSSWNNKPLPAMAKITDLSEAASDWKTFLAIIPESVGSFTYDPATGNVSSYVETKAGFTYTWTINYNPDGTVQIAYISATSNPTQALLYMGMYYQYDANGNVIDVNNVYLND